MVKPKPRDDDIKFEAEERKKRMVETSTRIGRTESGYRFLNRIREIGKPKPLHSEPEEEQGE